MGLPRDARPIHHALTLYLHSGFAGRAEALPVAWVGRIMSTQDPSLAATLRYCPTVQRSARQTMLSARGAARLDRSQAARCKRRMAICAGHRAQQGSPGSSISWRWASRCTRHRTAIARRRPCTACQEAVTSAKVFPVSRGKRHAAALARRRPGVACQGSTAAPGAARRHDERARRVAVLTGRRPQPTAAAAVTRRPCGDLIKKAPSARAAASASAAWAWGRSNSTWVWRKALLRVRALKPKRYAHAPALTQNQSNLSPWPIHCTTLKQVPQPASMASQRDREELQDYALRRASYSGAPLRRRRCQTA